MNSYILFKLNTQKALNRQDYLIQIIETLANEYKNIIWKFWNQNIDQVKKRKIVVFVLTAKKQKLGVNEDERFALHVTKAYIVLA